MSDDFPTPDEIINGTYKTKKAVDQPPAKAAAPLNPAYPVLDAAEVLTADQQKAIDVIVSGMPFVIVGIKQTFDDPSSPTTATGSDFFTAAGGDIEALRAAAPHLDGVLKRLYAKRGWV